MARKRRQVKPLPTIWEAPDELWKQIEPIIEELDPPAKTGRPRNDPRRSLNGIIYQMRSGVQWNYLPRVFGSDSACIGRSSAGSPWGFWLKSGRG